MVEALDRLAQAGAAGDVRVIDDTLISRWESARTHRGRQWKPTRAYVLYLIQHFAAHLTLASAQTWAAQAGYQISPPEMEEWFATSSAVPALDQTRDCVRDCGITVPARHHNLLAPLTSFVGRESKILSISQIVSR